MAIRIWLKPAAKLAFETKQEMKYGKMRDVSRLNGVEVYSEKGGEMYIDFYVDPVDPAVSVPTVARKYIKRVSFMDNYQKGFRTDGIYKLKGATARVETERTTQGGFDDEERTEEVKQNISISAGSVRTLREIYSKVRTGELKPVANWGIHQVYLNTQSKREATTTEY